MPITVNHIKTVTIGDGTNTNLARPSDWNSNHSVSVSLANNEVVKFISAGTNSVSSGTVRFDNANGVTFGMATDGGITASIAGGGATASLWPLYPLPASSAWISLAQNSVYGQPFQPDVNVTCSYFVFPASISYASSSVSNAVGQTIQYGVYVKGAGTNSTRWESYATSSASMGASASSNLSAGYTIMGHTSSSAGTQLMSAFSGGKQVKLPFSTSLAAGGDYLFVMRHSTSSVGNTGPMRLSMLGHSGAINLGSWGIFGSNGASTVIGSITNPFNIVTFTTTTANIPAVLLRSDMSAATASRMFGWLEV